MIDATKGFTIVRVLSAIPERIWQAWTRADEVSQWWHPPGSSTPRETVEMNAAAGGVGGSQGDRFLYDGWAGVLDSLQAHVQQG